MCVAACFMKFLALVGLHDIEPPPAASNSQIPIQVRFPYTHLAWFARGVLSFSMSFFWKAKVKHCIILR